MTNRISNTLFGLAIIWIFTPWAAGLLDFVWIFFTGGCLTSIPWQADGGWREMAGFFWVPAWFIFTMMFACQ